MGAEGAPETSSGGRHSMDISCWSGGIVEAVKLVRRIKIEPGTRVEAMSADDLCGEFGS